MKNNCVWLIPPYAFQQSPVPYLSLPIPPTQVCISAVPVSHKEQVKEGLGSALITLAELRFNRASDDVQVDSPWLQTFYAFNLDSHYKPSKEFVALFNRTKLRRRAHQANVQCLATVSDSFVVTSLTIVPING